MRRLRKTFLIALAALFSSPLISTEKQFADWVNYDRMRAIERFLDAVYPQLQQEKGLLTFRTMEFNIASTDTLYVSFVRCRVGSGVPAGGGTFPPPNCGNFLDSGSSAYLNFTVETGPREFPIGVFDARGEFVAAKLEELRKEMKAHQEWSERETLNALNQAQPKFGPDNRRAFLQTIPADAIYRFSGCRLDVNSAKFLWAGPYWSVPGTYNNGKRGAYPCSVSFEPFEGRLLGIGRV
jgi:hypothetical protein